MFRLAADFFRRIFWSGGNYRPSTEVFQNAIRTHLSMNGSVFLQDIAVRSFPSVESTMREYGIAEAAQILVNRGEIVAELSGRRVDPVSVGISGVRLRIKQ